MELALPHDLTDEQHKQLVTDLVREQFMRKGMIADIAIHEPSNHGDQRNYHAHVLLTMREIGPDGFGPKVREWNDRGNVEKWREAWERTTNRYLERHGRGARMDRRTHEAQGIEREPTQHRGPHVDAMERKGIRTDRRQWREEHRHLPAEALGKALATSDLKELQELRGELRTLIHEIRYQLATDLSLTKEQKATIREARSQTWDEFQAVKHEVTKRRLQERQTGQKPVREIVADAGREGKHILKGVVQTPAEAVKVTAKTVDNVPVRSVGKGAEIIADVVGGFLEGLAESISPTQWTPEQLQAQRDRAEARTEQIEFDARKYIEDREYRARYDEQERERREKETLERAAKRQRDEREQ
jgi:hypothetical protein